VVEELHFGRAAKRLHITQSPLSRQIQLLEYTLTVPTLHQNESFRAANTGGTRVQNGGATATGDRRELGLGGAATLAGQAGVLKMGFTAGSGYRHLPRLLTRASSVLKDVEVVLEEMVTVQQIDTLKSNQIDLGLGRQPPNYNQTDGIMHCPRTSAPRSSIQPPSCAQDRGGTYGSAV